MSPEKFEEIRRIVASLASPGREWPKREPDEHGPEEDCRGMCGAVRCVDKEVSSRSTGASP